ncbi:MAG TPA: formate dehydrogenase accessory protein FdhE [Myxococcales bacterium]
MGPPPPSPEAAFQKRARRAFLLADQSPTAQEALTFAAHLYRAQAELAARLADLQQRTRFTGSLSVDLDRFLPQAGAMLGGLGNAGNAVLSRAAQERAGESAEVAASRLLVCWAGDCPGEEHYLSRAILRPYVETLAAFGVAPNRAHRPGYCPFCGGAPWIAARRSASNADGAQRMLGCSLCSSEWSMARIRCPSCSEEDPRKLPYFQTDTYPVARIEVCEACARYVKSIDLSLDARPIPEVDDLLSIALDVWAGEQGFTRIEPGLAGI